MSPSCERPGVGDAVADHLVDRRAHALREAVVVERRRVGVALDVQLVDVHVDLVGGDAGPHHLAGQAQDLGGDGAGVAHPLDDLGRLDPRLVPRGPGRRCRRTAAGRCAPARSASGLTTPGSTRPSERLWQRLYLRPLPHQHGSLACGRVVGGLASVLHRDPGYGLAPGRFPFPIWRHPWWAWGSGSEHAAAARRAERPLQSATTARGAAGEQGIRGGPIRPSTAIRTGRITRGRGPGHPLHVARHRAARAGAHRGRGGGVVGPRRGVGAVVDGRPRHRCEHRGPHAAAAVDAVAHRLPNALVAIAAVPVVVALALHWSDDLTAAARPRVPRCSAARSSSPT